MRKVVDARQVCHLWANKSQDQARTPSDNLYFYGPTLCSYGSHFVIGHHLDNGGILWNNDSYSNTTAKQKSHAWGALASWQRKTGTLYSVPSMNRQEVDELERMRREKAKGKLPALVEKCVSAIIDKVQAMASMKEGKGPESSAFHYAKEYESTGRYLCEYVGKGIKWPLPALPETMPTGDAKKAFIVSIAKGKLLATHEEALGRALRSIAELEQLATDAADEETFSDWWRINNARGSLDGAGRNLNEAGKAYEAATGKKSVKVRNAWKKHSAIEARILPLVNVYEAKRARAALRSLTRDAYTALHGRKQRDEYSRVYRRRSEADYVHSKMADALAALPEGERDSYAALLARLRRVADWDAAETGLSTARESWDSAMSYLPQHPADAAREFRNAQARAHDAGTRHAGFAALHADELAAIIQGGQTLRADALASIARVHAAKVEAWKAGENVSLSYEAGTFARIKGNIVQTSRGASVPLSHACRLARIARRVIAHGGKTWEHGAGPRVGGFMVRSIGADGSAVIGCHEFEGSESLRMLALLDACPECQGVTEESDEG